MVANKGGGGGGGGGSSGAGAGAAAGLTNIIQPTAAECCMCGDYGLSQELFRCKICKSRFQHKYCSNQYPKAELYKACNWCLTQKHDSGNSSNSSSSCRNDSGCDHTVRNKRTPDDRIGHRGLRGRMKASEIELTSKGLIRKLHQTSPEEKSPAFTARKRVAGAVVMEDEKRVMLRKSKSASHLSHGGGNGITTKPVLRNKVRRYKLLDEVTSQ